MAMEYKFNPLLVTLSILVAIFASYVALNIANNLNQAKGRARAFWLTCGALAMGVGIWSMHFVGMLAFEMPGMAMAYDVPLMVLSILVAIGASALGLYIVSRPVVPFGSILTGGIAMAAAISGMHYIGMFSMRMSARIVWNPYLVVLSVLIALAASFGALFVLVRQRGQGRRSWELPLASVVMGIAVSGMHYTGMFAGSYVHTPEDPIESSHLLVSSGLTLAVMAMTILILALALASSVGQRLWQSRSRKAAESLSVSEEKFRHLVEAVKDYAIFMLDPSGYITTWNMGAERITGYPASEVIGGHVSMFYPPEDIENRTLEKELSTAATTGHFEGEGRRLRKDGRIYVASIVLSPLFGGDGTVIGYSKVVRDITADKASERRMRLLNDELERHVLARTRALERREGQLRTITNAVPNLIAQLDAGEQLLFANDTFLRWFNGEKTGLVGKTLREIMGEQRYEGNRPYIERALAGEIVSYERLSQTETSSATLGITFIPEFDDDKKVSGFIVVANDISKYKAIQEELRQAKEAAEVANEAKSAFLANMSHEIRTPLGAVLGFSELLLNGELSISERVNSVEVIKRNGRLLSNIINDILDLSKVEAGKLEIEKVDVPFSEIMAEIGSVLSLEADEKGIELRVTSEGAIPSHIQTDPLRLRQVLLNIVGNAIKFTNRGWVQVRVKAVPSDSGAIKLAFIVKDTGEGIAPEQRHRLFKPFTQADASTTRKFGGTGLGLVLSRKLAQALGGDIELTETVRGEGSTFTITIDPGVSEIVSLESSVAVRASSSLSLKEFKVLLVDDSLDNQALIQKILRLAGAEVVTAGNGREAVDKAMSGEFSLILMDLQMPEMDGFEATKRLRELGYKKPIIALTAHAMKEERQRSLRSGFDDHITKPIDREYLIRTLTEYPV